METTNTSILELMTNIEVEQQIYTEDIESGTIFTIIELVQLPDGSDEFTVTKFTVFRND
jgi:hypothetical protein